MKNILIVDSDLRFVSWLCQVLDAAGYETIPAKGVAQAMQVVADLDVWVDILIARPTLSGADGFAKELRSSQQGQLKTIALIDRNDEPCDSLAAWDRCQDKSVSAAIAGPVFLSLVQTILKKGTDPRIA